MIDPLLVPRPVTRDRTTPAPRVRGAVVPALTDAQAVSALIEAETSHSSLDEPPRTAAPALLLDIEAEQALLQTAEQFAQAPSAHERLLSMQAYQRSGAENDVQAEAQEAQSAHGDIQV